MEDQLRTWLTSQHYAETTITQAIYDLHSFLDAEAANDFSRQGDFRIASWFARMNIELSNKLQKRCKKIFKVNRPILKPAAWKKLRRVIVTSDAAEAYVLDVLICSGLSLTRVLSLQFSELPKDSCLAVHHSFRCWPTRKRERVDVDDWFCAITGASARRRCSPWLQKLCKRLKLEPISIDDLRVNALYRMLDKETT